MSRPSILAIVPFHRPENEPYLSACLMSVAPFLGPERECVVIADCPVPADYIARWPNVRFVIDSALNFPARKFNAIISTFTADFYFLLSDDVILGRDAADEMMDAAKRLGCRAIVGADSNGEDVAFSMNRTLPFPDAPHGPTPGFTERVMAYKPEASDALIRPIRLKTHAVLVPRRVIDEVGLADEQFVCAFDDMDYQVRCRILKVERVLTQRAYIHHFGGVTLGRPDSLPDYKAMGQRFLKKWDGHNGVSAALAFL